MGVWPPCHSVAIFLYSHEGEGGKDRPSPHSRSLPPSVANGGRQDGDTIWSCSNLAPLSTSRNDLTAIPRELLTEGVCASRLECTDRLLRWNHPTNSQKKTILVPMGYENITEGGHGSRLKSHTLPKVCPTRMRKGNNMTTLDGQRPLGFGVRGVSVSKRLMATHTKLRLSRNGICSGEMSFNHPRQPGMRTP